MAVNIGKIRAPDVAPAGDTKPDSITTDGNSTFIEYANNSQSDGSGGSSQIVQYDKSGSVLATYTVSGTVDGLKFNPNNGLIYALQNQDGKSTLTLIDPKSGHQSSPIAYANTSATQGYDDIVFDGKRTFLSYTNPSSPTDPVISQLSNGNTPFAPLQVTPVLLDGATEFNTVTHQANQPIPLTDPDSLKLTSNGDLMLTGAADGSIIDVHNPGKKNQSVSFTQVTDANGNPASGLDDVIKPTSSSGTFTLVDTTNNKVETFKANNLNTNFYYASVDSLGGFGQINPHTGVFTLLVPASGAHGLSFKPSPSNGDAFTYVHHDSAPSDAAHSTTAGIPARSAQLAVALHDTSHATDGMLATHVDAGTASMLASADLHSHHAKPHG